MPLSKNVPVATGGAQTPDLAAVENREKSYALIKLFVGAAQGQKALFPLHWLSCQALIHAPPRS